MLNPAGTETLKRVSSFEKNTFLTKNIFANEFKGHLFNMWGELWTDDDGGIVVLTHEVLITSLFRSAHKIGWEQFNNQHETVECVKLFLTRVQPGSADEWRS